MAGFKDWETKFNKDAQATLEKAYKVNEAAATELFKRIKDRTPVGDPSLWNWPAHKDYVPGTLKASWTMEHNNTEIVISNDQPYAERVENGWSTQAPAGMVRISILEWDSILRKMAKSYRK